ncbi:MAG: helix-turn-helix domain-containing protein [Pirellulales bacterium]
MGTAQHDFQPNERQNDPIRGAPGHEAARLHRIRSIRLRQGMSLRTVARRMQLTVSQIREREDETRDMALSELHHWQRALDVPITELLAEEDETLSTPVLRRARMLKIMKTARAILDNTESLQLERLTQRLVDQLVEVMPELQNISPWHATGQRRTLDELGRIAEHPFPDHFLMDGSEV